MITYIKKFIVLPSSIEDLMIFCIPSSLFFSNALSAGNSGEDGGTGASIPAYFFTLLSVICIPFIQSFKENTFKKWLIIFSIIFIGQLYALYENVTLLIPFIYKSLGFLPLLIIFSENKLVNKLIKFSISSFCISLIISIILLLLGQGEHKYIYYVSTANLVRFAALTIEPGGFALGYTALIFLIIIKKRLTEEIIFNPLTSFLLLIPYVLSLSTSFIYYLLLYFFMNIDNFNFKINKLNGLFLLFFSTISSYYLFIDRGLISIAKRLFIASNIIEDNRILYFLGNGIYTLKGAPAYLSLVYELGILTCILLIAYLLTHLTKTGIKELSYLVIAILPVIASETYGSIFLWSPFMLSIYLTQTKKVFIKEPLSNVP